MSSPQIRRADRVMSDERTLETLHEGTAAVSREVYVQC
jgi:hypothetical protein